MSEFIDEGSSFGIRPAISKGEKGLRQRQPDEVSGFRTAGIVIGSVVLGVAQLADEVERDQDKSPDEQ